MISEGSSVSLSAAVSGRIFSQIKYLNISYSGELQVALLTWLPSFVSLGLTPDMPPSFIDRFPQRHVPYVFEKYDVPSSCLVNIWESFGIIVFVTALLLISKGIEHIVSPKDNPRLAPITRKARVMVQNFLVTALYGVYGDLVLFAIIEYRTLEFGWNLSLLSLIISMILIITMVLTFLYQIKLLLSYQKIKKQNKNLSSEPSKELEIFMKENEGSQVIFKDFKDYSLAPQLFLFFLSGRDLLFSLILATMFEYPLPQTILITILYVLMIAYLLKKRPFEGSFDFGQQLFFEFIGLAVNICVFINAILDAGNYQTIQARKNIGKLIIFANMIFNFVTAGFMVYSVGQILWEFYKSRQQKRVKKLETLRIPHRIPKLAHQETSNISPSNSHIDSIVNHSQNFGYSNKNNTSETISFQQESFDLSFLIHPVQPQNQYHRPRRIRKPEHERTPSIRRAQVKKNNYSNEKRMQFDQVSQPNKVYKYSSQVNQKR